MHAVRVMVHGRLPAPVPFTQQTSDHTSKDPTATKAIPGVFFSYKPPEIFDVRPSFLLDFAQVFVNAYILREYVIMDTSARSHCNVSVCQAFFY